MEFFVNKNIFSNSQTNGPQKNGNQLSENNQPEEKSNQLRALHSARSRQQKLSRLRQMNAITFIPYENISFRKFSPFVEAQENPYSLLATIFVIVDSFTWRQYLCHLELLIKKFTNYISTSKGKVFEEIINKEDSRKKLGGFNFQERLESMLHLSNKEFQQHLLILIHAIIAYNKRYFILDECALSNHLVYKQPYQKSLRPEVIWLMTRMSVSCQALNKLMKQYLSNIQATPLLALLTIFGNFIYQYPEEIVLQFISSNDFQTILFNGFNSGHFETERESIFICNNLLFKSLTCHKFIRNLTEEGKKILGLNNQQALVFQGVIENWKNSQEESKSSEMEEENTLEGGALR